MSRLSPAGMRRILRQEDTGYLSMSRAGEPYAVPVSYAYLDGRIVIHCALKGRKLDFLRANPRVCFAVSRHPDRTKPHHAEGKCDFRFESVLCFGRARVVASASERLKWLRRFKTYFYRRLGLDARKDPVPPKVGRGVGCILITIGRITGRRRP